MADQEESITVWAGLWDYLPTVSDEMLDRCCLPSCPAHKFARQVRKERWKKHKRETRHGRPLE